MNDETVKKVVAAILDYDNMKLIIKNTPDSAKGERIEISDLMLDRRSNAQIFVDWFEPMWNELSDFERKLLDTYKVGTVAYLAEKSRYTPRHVRRLRQNAAMKLGQLLYGKMSV